jgi:hypothetical protein
MKAFLISATTALMTFGACAQDDSRNRTTVLAPASLWRVLSLSLVAFALLAACSSLDKAEKLQQAKLAVNESSKKDVVDAIGLPKSIQREADGTEVWLYSGAADSTSFFVPMPFASVPSGANMQTVYYTNIGGSSKALPSDIRLICFFDGSGILRSYRKGGEGK